MGSNGPSWHRRALRVRLAEEAARNAQHKTDRLVIIAWNARMGEGGPSQPSPTISVALECGYRYLRVHCQACRQRAWIELSKVRRPADAPVWKLEGALACQPCKDRGARRRVASSSAYQDQELRRRRTLAERLRAGRTLIRSLASTFLKVNAVVARGAWGTNPFAAHVHSRERQDAR